MKDNDLLFPFNLWSMLLIKVLKQNLKQWKESRIDKVEGVETIDQVHLEPHEYQAEEEVEPQWAEDPGEGDYD